MKFLSIVVTFLGVSSLNQAQADESGPLPLATGSSSIVKDSTGTIWGAITSSNSKLKRWQDGGWGNGEYSPTPEALILGLWTRSDGRVVAFWNSGQPLSREFSARLGYSDDYVLTTHYGIESKVLGKFHFHPDGAADPAVSAMQIFRTNASPFLFCYQGRDFYNVSDDGIVKKIYSVPSSMIDEPKSMPDSGSLKMSPLNFFYPIADQMGRIWLWQDGSQDAGKTRRFNGLLRYENGVVTTAPYFSGLPVTRSTPFRAGWGRDIANFYVALRGSGLFQVDLHTLKASPVKLPQPGDFDFITEIWSDGDELDVVTGLEDPTTTDPTLGYQTLWRRRNGRWSRVIDGLDSTPSVSSSRHGFLKNDEGLWVTSEGRGAWFVGDDGRARQVDWQRGVNLLWTKSLLATPGNSALLGSNAGTVRVPSFSALAEKHAPATMSPISFYLPPIQDGQLCIWAIRNLRDHALHQWDGSGWIKHPLPGGYPLRTTEELALDGKGRVWVTPGKQAGPTAIFDQKRRRWRTFADYPGAVVANRDDSLPVPSRVHYRSDERQPVFAPQRGPQGQLAFVAEGKKLYLFDGQKLQSWLNRELNDPFSWLDFTSPPFFGSQGQLCMEFNGANYGLTASGWKKTTSEVDPYRKAKYANPNSPIQQIEVPQRLQSNGELDPSPMTGQWAGGGYTDLEGTVWLFKENNFYRAGRFPDPRIAIPVLNSSDNTPFGNSTVLTKVMVDRVGNTFIQISGWSNGYFMLKTDQPVPETAAELEVTSLNGATVHFSATGTPATEARFGWRVDGGPWSESAKTTELHLEGLRPGKHFVEVKAVGANGRPDPTPARAEWTVAFESIHSLRTLIAQLSDPEFSRREVAIAPLARQHQRSLPLLRRALAAAEKAHDADKVWWLSAAIREVEKSVAEN